MSQHTDRALFCAPTGCSSALLIGTYGSPDTALNVIIRPLVNEYITQESGEAGQQILAHRFVGLANAIGNYFAGQEVDLVDNALG
jgi:hypothetical protein